MVSIALLALFVITGFLKRSYYAERQILASRHFEAANKLAQQGNDRGAVEQFRATLPLA